MDIGLKHKILIALITVSIIVAVAGSVAMNVWYIPDTEHIRAESLEKKALTELEDDLKSGIVKEIYMSTPSPDVYVMLNDGTYYRTQNPGSTDFKYDLMNPR